MKPILEIEHISKTFRIAENQQPYLSLRDQLATILRPPRKADYHALNDVSATIFEGETIGIIGKNGAGKSTLLKVLSRITPPTSGRIVSRGRIASLLEVGTGFHAELTGRENVFMNGSILGMRKKEIDRNFDEIIDFSGVEQFIDTPLKHYSSGMQLRLAFAVAAFMQNEILIVDEVLAVGDAEFQKKCMGKMSEVSRSGRTILFVSHNMSAVRHLCQRGIVLQSGTKIFDGAIDEAITRYMQQGQGTGDSAYAPQPDESRKLQLMEARLVNRENTEAYTYDISEPFFIDMLIQIRKPVSGTYGYITIANDFQEFIVESDSKDGQQNFLDNLDAGLHRFRLEVPPFLLPHGSHTINVAFSSPFDDEPWLHNAGDILQVSITDSFTQRGSRRTAKTSHLLKWNKHA